MHSQSASHRRFTPRGDIPRSGTPVGAHGRAPVPRFTPLAGIRVVLTGPWGVYEVLGYKFQSPAGIRVTLTADRVTRETATDLPLILLHLDASVKPRSWPSIPRT
jgi:hypothetical protein